jgi:hypothetical protein
LRDKRNVRVNYGVNFDNFAALAFRLPRVRACRTMNIVNFRSSLHRRHCEPRSGAAIQLHGRIASLRSQ